MRLNEPAVCHETIDGEVVVVDFDTGDYYSMVGPAALIWAAVAKGASVAQVWARLGLRDCGARQRAADFIGELAAAGLIVATGEEVVGGDEAEAPEAADFGAPVMQKFSDMQELLMADPLHDVDEFGWPSRRPDPVA